MTCLRHSWYLALRDMRAIARQPGFIAVALVQPVIWLLLFGALFERVADIPSFDGNYIDYLAPGVLIMNALMSPGWSGMSTVQEIERGITDRFRRARARRRGVVRLGRRSGGPDRDRRSARRRRRRLQPSRLGGDRRPRGHDLLDRPLLAAFVLACGTLAIRAFGSYQRSI